MTTFSEEGGQVTAPPRCRPRPYGLMSVAEPDPRDDNEWARGLEFDQIQCAPAVNAAAAPCPPLPEQLEKTTVRGYGTVDQCAFALYAGWECSAVEAAESGRPWDMADALYDAGWEHGLERALWTGADQDDNALCTSLTGGGAADLTPGAGALSVIEGVAALESYMAANTACRPTILANVGLGPYLAAKAQLVRREGHLETYGGSLVALGGGFLDTGPGGSNPDPDEAWIFAVGAVRVTWGPRFNTPGRGDVAGAVAMASNDVTVFTEQLFSVGLGCGIAAVRVVLGAS